MNSKQQRSEWDTRISSPLMGSPKVRRKSKTCKEVEYTFFWGLFSVTWTKNDDEL